MDKKFWIKFSIWTIFACIVPFGFIAWRYKIFEVTDAEVSLTGWGLIALIIVFLFVFYILKKICDILKNEKWSLTLQIISGVKNVILPLILVYFFIHRISSNIAFFEQCLILITISEAIAIPFNPIPEYEGQRKEIKENKLIDKIVNLLGTGEKGEQK